MGAVTIEPAPEMNQPTFEIRAATPAPARGRARCTWRMATWRRRVRALATRGSVKMLEPRDVEALGYEMALGNTFHLFLSLARS